MRYYMKEQGQPLSQIDVKERFEAMSVEERISFLHKLEGICYLDQKLSEIWIQTSYFTYERY